VTVAACAALLTGVSPVMAHHSFQAEYDATKTITVKGTIQKLEWVNPHAYFWVDVKDANGKVTTYAFEALSPNALARQGWNRNSLKKGEEVTVDGYLAKDGKLLADGSIHANSKGVTRADGTKVFQGSSADEAYTGSAK
jgi:hypothetical protein